MARKLLAQTRSRLGTVLLSADLLADPFSVAGEGLSIDFGNPKRTAIGRMKKNRGEFTTDDDWTTRTIALYLNIKGSDLDDLASHYASFVSIVTADTWELVYNSGGATETDRYYDCFETIDTPDLYNYKTWVGSRHELHLQIDARPFARGDAVILPRNWVKDACMCEDFNNDGIPNSFVAYDSGTPATGTVTIDAAEAATKITVTGGAAGRWKGIKQVLPAGCLAGVNSRYIEYKIEGVANGATVSIEVTDDDWTTMVYASANIGWTRFYNGGNGMGYGGTPELQIKVLTSGASSAATLWVRNASLVAGTLPAGKDGLGMFYCSELAETPGTMAIRNLPGDVPATAELLFVNQALTPVTLSGVCRIYAGLTAVSENDQYESFVIKDFTNPVVNADCIGGLYGGSAGTNYPFTNRPQCAYILMARTRSSDVAAATTRRYFQQVINPDSPVWDMYIGPQIRPYAGSVGASKWALALYGTYENPLRGVSPWRNAFDRFYPNWGGTVDNIDWNAFMPVDQYFRADVRPPVVGSQYIHIISDSSSMTPDNPGFSVCCDGTLKTDYTGTFHALSSPHDGNPVTLAPGPYKNLMMMLCTTFQDNAGVYDKKAGGLMMIRYTPRYL